MNYLPRVIDIKNLEQAKKEFEEIGVDMAAIRIMVPKLLHRIIKLKDIKPIAANIIKQEMLSFGGDAAIAYGALNQSIKKTDILIFGSERQFLQLTNKLRQHQFGLPLLARQIEKSLKNYNSYPKPIKVGKLKMEFGKRTYIMGILNVTPDSFSDGGKFRNIDEALKHAKEMIKAGADIIDVGGESTRPGAKAVSAKEEIKRVIPVIKRLSKETKVAISIDTTKSTVAEAALRAGANMINDISGLHFDRKIAKVSSQFGAPLIVMHIKGTPRTMQKDPKYDDLLSEVSNFLAEAINTAKKFKAEEDKIIIDPGIGFGKSVEHNLELLRRLSELRALGRPILVGVSRKSFIGKILDLPAEKRLEGTMGAAAVAIVNGADIIRVHDVAEIKKVAKLVDSIVRRG